MCGINLVVDKTGAVSLESLKRMVGSTKYRGPDQTQFKILRKNNLQILLGVTRLRIVDHNENSDQPFFDTDEDHILLFNGEIYNHREIKNQLMQQGFHFNTTSDTEVLFYFLKSDQFDRLTEINGMYSFVFVNLKDNTILMARDPWGMKPLYYFRNDRYLIISSEIRGIISSGLVSKTLNIEQIPYYFRYRYCNAPHTLFKGIFQFQKGKLYAFNLNYFKLDEVSFPESETDNCVTLNEYEDINKLEELLINSLILHSQADGPIGLFLSGGIDSTLLLALSVNHGVTIPYIFSIINKDREKNFGTEDYKFVKLAVQQYHQTADIIELDDTLLDEMDSFITMMDHPVADPAFLLTYKLSEIAKRKTNVVLSGAGGDELFGGYNRHLAYLLYLKYHGVIIKWMKVIKGLGQLFPSDLNFYGRKKLKLLNKFIDKVDVDPWQTFDNFLSFEKLSTPLIPNEWNQKPITDFIEQYLMCALERDRQEYLPEDILTVSDRASMLNGVEMRMPYLDQNITKFVKQIPATYLIRHGRKWMLKKLINKYNGEKYSNRAKEGFGFPFGHWIRETKYQHLINKLTDSKNLLFEHIQREKIVKLLQEHMSCKDDHSQELWSLLVLSIWIEKHFD